MYHPAAALHQGSLRRVIEEDFKRIPTYIEIAQKEREAAAKPAPLLVAAAPEPAQMKLL